MTQASTVPAPAFCGLLPHPPIVVPAVGRDRVEGCRSTLDACRRLARDLVARGPDRLFLVSPHSPRARRAFGLWSGPRLRGDLGRFGAPRAAVDLPNDREQAAALADAAAAEGLSTWDLDPSLADGGALDHGAVVPLWFLVEAGWDGPTCIASLPWIAEPATHLAFGRALRRAAATLPGRLAIVASGDMSHRCLPEAPAGFHPRAVEFDQRLTDLVRRGELRAIADIDPELRELAAEDAADTAMIAASAIGFEPHGLEVLSYEHPFGVGYLVAVFHDGAAA